jgi:hypothetical protein
MTLACTEGHPQVVQALLDAGADPNLADVRRGGWLNLVVLWLQLQSGTLLFPSPSHQTGVCVCMLCPALGRPRVRHHCTLLVPWSVSPPWTCCLAMAPTSIN